MDSLISLWPLLLALLALFILVGLWDLGRAYLRKRRLSRAGMDQIDVMDGKDFEMFLEGLFQRLGYEVERTRYQKDFGADLVITKEGTRTVVQAKRSASKIGVLAVQQVVASKAYYKADATMVVSNHVYTRPAKILAKVNVVDLWDREALIQAIFAAKQREQGATSPSAELATPPGRDKTLDIPTPAPTLPTPAALPQTSPAPAATLPSWLDGMEPLPEEPTGSEPRPRPASLKGKGQKL